MILHLIFVITKRKCFVSLYIFIILIPQGWDPCPLGLSSSAYSVYRSVHFSFMSSINFNTLLIGGGGGFLSFCVLEIGPWSVLTYCFTGLDTRLSILTADKWGFPLLSSVLLTFFGIWSPINVQNCCLSICFYNFNSNIANITNLLK